jgi:cephalosporin hydroxylase
VLGKRSSWTTVEHKPAFIIERVKLAGKIKDQLGFFRSAATRYHLWYYRNLIWDTTTWLGVKTLKSPSDMWNYQEILSTLRPGVVIEFGTRFGGSALFFACVMRQIGNRFKVLSVDIDAESVSEKTRNDRDIELLTISSLDSEVAERIEALRSEYPGPAFAILDSDHRKDHVLAEMKLLRPLLVSGDYLVIEDSNVNGHPVYSSHGPGPFEAETSIFASFQTTTNSTLRVKRNSASLSPPKDFWFASKPPPGQQAADARRWG